MKQVLLQFLGKRKFGNIRELEMRKFRFLFFVQDARMDFEFFCTTKAANSLKVSKTCFSLDKKFTTIIPEIEVFFVCPLVGQMYENSPYDFKDPKFLIR